MRPLSFIFICIALVRISGLDLALAQMNAWAHMIYDRSESGLSVAISSTFSGEAPCEKCLELQKEKEKRNAPDIINISSLDKLKLTPPHATHPALLLEDAVLSHNFPPAAVLATMFEDHLDPPPPRYS